MNNKAVSIIDLIKYEYLELYAFILLILWAINPFVEILLRKYARGFYTWYFYLCIFLVGVASILTCWIYLLKKVKDKQTNIKKSVPYLFMLILLIISIISTIFSSNPKLSLFGESYRREGLIIYINYIGFILSASIIKNKKHINTLFSIIIISALFISIMPLLSRNFSFYEFSNIYLNRNHYGYFLMIATCLSAFKYLSDERKRKYLFMIGYIILLYMLIMNDTFGCYLALFISLIAALIYCIVKRNRIIKSVILIVLFISTSFVVNHFQLNIGLKYNESINIVGNNMSSFKQDLLIILRGDVKSLESIGSYRGQLWYGAINYTMEHPLIGGGFETLKYYYLSQGIRYNDRPHNILLQISSSIGIPGALIYLSFICYLAIANLKRINTDGTNIIIYFTAMSYFISSQFGNSMYYTSPYFMILVGLLIGMYLQYDKKTKKQKTMAKKWA